MFEWYTEGARRTIFFGRYEASQYGSEFIETEHLLLGLLREDGQLFTALLKAADVDAIRKEIDSQLQRRGKVSVTVDMPLTNTSKRVLTCAAQEADGLGHRHIGTEHLLLGLLREPDTLAARTLLRYGFELEAARRKIAEIHPREKSPAARSSHILPLEQAQGFHEVVRVRHADLRRDWVQGILDRSRGLLWRKTQWKPRDIVVHEASGRVSFDLSLAGEAGFRLQPGGWQMDECLICRWELHTSDDPEHSVGYTNGRDWVCSECFSKLLENPGLFTPPHSDLA